MLKPEIPSGNYGLSWYSQQPADLSNRLPLLAIPQSLGAYQYTDLNGIDESLSHQHEIPQTAPNQPTNILSKDNIDLLLPDLYGGIQIKRSEIRRSKVNIFYIN